MGLDRVFGAMAARDHGHGVDRGLILLHRTRFDAETIMPTISAKNMEAESPSGIRGIYKVSIPNDVSISKEMWERTRDLNYFRD